MEDAVDPVCSWFVRLGRRDPPGYFLETPADHRNEALYVHEGCYHPGKLDARAKKLKIEGHFR